MDGSRKIINFYSVLLALCIAIPYLGNYELTFFLWCSTLLITIQRQYSLSFLKYTSCFVAIVVIAFFSTHFSEVSIFYFIRDITYLIKPVIGLLVGYQLCKYIHKDLFKLLIYIGFGIAVIHLFIMLNAVLQYGARTVHDLRFYGGYFSDFEVYALVILMFHKSFEISFSKRWYYLMVIVIGFSSFMYLARTHFIQFFILFMGLKGFLILNRRAIKAIGIAVLTTLIAYSAVLYVNPKRNGKGMEAFLYKIKNAPTEPFKSRINSDDYIDFNDNYRSVEIILTRKQVASGGTSAILFGKGLGSQVDLKQKVYLGDIFQRYISVLHNSFMTVYLKSGLLGVSILGFSMWLLYRQPRSDIPIIRKVNYLLAGTAIFLIVSNWVLMGYYFTMDSKSILVGLLIAYKVIHIRNVNRNEQLQQE